MFFTIDERTEEWLAAKGGSLTIDPPAAAVG